MSSDRQLQPGLTVSLLQFLRFPVITMGQWLSSSSNQHQSTPSIPKMDLRVPVSNEIRESVSNELRESVSNQNDVSLMVAKHLISTEAKNCNLVFSPLSINLVLGIIAAGSEGPTLEQLLSFLKSKSIGDLNSLFSQLVTLVLADGSPHGGPRLRVANGVWVDLSLPLKRSFKKIVADDYKGVSSQVDFQHKAVEVTKEINLWAEKGTNGLIKEILTPGSVDSATRLILGNALYYKGTWCEKFDASKTKNHKFYLLNGSSIQVPFMTSENKQYISAFNGFKALRLPYNQGSENRLFSMYIFLPDAKNGLPALVEKVTSKPGFLDRCLPRSQVDVDDFLIPKFKISFGFEASQLLKRLGLVQPFRGEGLAEMVESTANPNLYVSRIFHKSFIEVNEEGTEAAAATESKLILVSATFEQDFVADHPFLFFIREDMTGALLFIGTILNPMDS